MRPAQLVVVVAALAGCATTVYRRYEFERMLASTAAGELSCPQSQLTITPLGDGIVTGTDLPVRERVEGCRQRVDYEVTHIGYRRLEPLITGGGTSEKGFPGCGTSEYENRHLR